MQRPGRGAQHRGSGFHPQHRKEARKKRPTPNGTPQPPPRAGPAPSRGRGARPTPAPPPPPRRGTGLTAAQLHRRAQQRHQRGQHQAFVDRQVAPGQLLAGGRGRRGRLRGGRGLRLLAGRGAAGGCRGRERGQEGVGRGGEPIARSHAEERESPPPACAPSPKPAADALAPGFCFSFPGPRVPLAAGSFSIFLGLASS